MSMIEFQQQVENAKAHLEEFWLIFPGETFGYCCPHDGTILHRTIYSDTQAECRYSCSANEPHVFAWGELEQLLSNKDLNFMSKPKLSLSVEDGMHNATVENVTLRTTPYPYMDLHLKLESGATMTHGISDNIVLDEKTGTPKSQLANLMTQFGEKINAIREYTLADYKTIFAGKTVTISVVNVTNTAGTFPKVTFIKLKA